jgi:hypothetical protein
VTTVTRLFEAQKMLVRFQQPPPLSGYSLVPKAARRGTSGGGQFPATDEALAETLWRIADPPQPPE